MTTKPKTLRAPSLLHHRPSGRAYVMTRDEHGDRRMLYLGAHGTAAAERAYQLFLSDFYRGVAAPPPRACAAAAATPDGARTIEDLCTEFLLFAESRFRRENGTPTGEAVNFGHAFQHLLKLYRDIPASKFKPSMLETVQLAMASDGLCRNVVNARVSRIRRMFRWAERREFVDKGTWHHLQCVAGLRRGEHAVRESKPVEPVPQAIVEEILPHLAPQLAAMVRLQMSTGARPGEITCMRMAMIDRSDPEAWIYRPPHKNGWRGQARTIPLLPADQELLKPFLRLDDKPLFSPRDAEKERGRENAHADVGDVYDTHAYAKGIARGVQAANAARVRARLLALLADELTAGATETIAKLATRRLIANHGGLRHDIENVIAPLTGTGKVLEAVLKELAELPLLAPFGANRLRHLAATKAAPVVGDDGVQLLLGHADGRTLKHYVQRDPRRVVDVRKRLG